MADLKERLGLLKENREKVNSKVIELKATAKKEEEIFLEIIKEIKDLGFNPKTLKEDLTQMEKDIESKISDKEKEIESVMETLSSIDKNVRDLEGYNA